MNIQIVCVGSLKERYWKEATGEYSRRLSKYCTLQIDDVQESWCRKQPSEAQIEMIKKAEGESILRRIKKDSCLIVLDRTGKKFSSEALAEKLQELPHAGKSQLTFVIGGSYGLDPVLLRKADLALSFSDMTFPHQLMRVILLEQVYRCFKIIRNEVYHK